MESASRKNIFLTLSNRAVHRNLFYFPGSFFELLKKEAEKRNWHIVLLVTPKDGKLYQGRLGEGLGKIYSIEVVKVPYPKRVISKVFYFFYSYLIYTDTTKLLATMGTRPDEPPAGGRRWLSPIKWFIARTFGLSKTLKRSFVPWMFFKLYPERPFSSLFEKYKPDLIFASHIYGWFDEHLIAESKRRGIPTAGMVANWDHMDKYFLAMHVDKLFVQSQELKTAGIRYQAYRENEMIVTGFPHFDFIVDKTHAKPRAEILESLGFLPDSKYILYASGSTYCPDEPDIIEGIIKMIDSGKFGSNVYLVIRPYLGGRLKDREFDEQKYNRFESHTRVRFYRADFWNNLSDGIYFMNVLRHAGAVVSIFSTIALESAVLDRPILAIDFDGYKKRPFHRSIRRFALFEHFQHVRATGAMPVANSFGELEAHLKDALESPERLSDARAKLRSELAEPLGGASERLLSGMSALMDKKI